MRSRAIILGSLCVAAVACDATPSPTGDCVEVRAPDGWVDADPPEWVELWRSGGPDSGVELAWPMSIQPGPDGRLAIPDFQLGLGGLSADGRWTGSLTRPGDGPGEVQMPLAAAYAPDGTLAVLDFVLAKVVFLDPDGGLVREARVDPVPTNRVYASGELHGVWLGGDGTAILLDVASHPAEPRAQQTLLQLLPDGSTADTLVVTSVPALDTESTAGGIAPGWPRLAAAIATDGRIAWAGHEAGYEIAVLDPDGEASSICRDVEPSPLRADETEPPESFPPASLDAYRDALAKAERPDRPAPISRLLFGRDGRLWVERERFGLADFGAPSWGRAGSLFDVFDRQGRYLGEIRAPEDVHVMAAAGDTVWAIEFGAFDVPSVVAYRIERANGEGS